jgi:hypothetical protein
MSCIQSFSFLISGKESFVYPELNTQGPNANALNWKYESTNATSTFQIQGFKNINIFKIEAVGNVFSPQSTDTYSSAMGLVNDWAFYMQLNGQNAPIIGNVTTSPNGWAMVTQPNNPIVAFSRFNPRIEFASPIQSVNSLQIQKLIASGSAGGNGDLLNIAWDLTFVVYYTFEGEEFAFL